MKLISILFLFIFSISTICSNEVIELTMGHFANETHIGNVASKMFADNVKRRTNGRINITIFPNNQLGSPIDLLKKNIFGTIDMSLPTHGQLAKYSNKFGCVMIPFIFDNYTDINNFLDGPFMNWVGSEIEDQGLVFLSNWEWGFRHITNNIRPIYNPVDINGLSVRTPPELANQLLMSGFGANVKTIAWPELPMALKQRVVDGQENPISVIYSYRIYETQKYLSITKHTYNSMVHVISKKTWDLLTPIDQSIIREESINSGNFMRKTIQKDEIKQLKELDLLGMDIIWPEIEEFKESIPKVYEELKYELGEDTYTAFMNMVADFKTGKNKRQRGKNES